VSTAGDLAFHYVLDCPCGTTLTGLSEDEIVEVAFAHLRDAHPEMADDYEREHVLAMARRLVRS
jgi:predicted small metal-binding protein